MEYLAMTIAIILFFIGLMGTALPILPGTALAWAGMVIHKLMMGAESVSWTFILIGLGVVAISYLFDLIFTWWGAKRFGATWKGALGAVIGGIIGLFFSLPGIILGPIIGAVLFEYINMRNERQALKAGVGAIVGGLAALVAKLALTAGLIAAFFVYLPDSPV